MAGKQVRCPRCARLIVVPAVDEVRKDVAPLRQGGEPAAVARPSYQPCPQCDATGAQRVPFTLWGSSYFTALFHHVRCPACGYCYNGRTGRSNALPAAVCVAVALLFLLGLVGYSVWLFHSKGYF
jgi:hypothetical protein